MLPFDDQVSLEKIRLQIAISPDSSSAAQIQALLDLIAEARQMEKAADDEIGPDHIINIHTYNAKADDLRQHSLHERIGAAERSGLRPALDY